MFNILKFKVKIENVLFQKEKSETRKDQSENQKIGRRESISWFYFYFSSEMDINPHFL